MTEPRLIRVVTAPSLLFSKTKKSVHRFGWTNWTPDAAGSDDEYVGGLVLADIGLERAPVEEAPAQEAAPEGE